MIKKPPEEDLERELWCMKMHNEFECIHPFVDGNGRTGRLLLNLLRFKHGFGLHIIRIEERWLYYDSIREYEYNREEYLKGEK